MSAIKVVSSTKKSIGIGFRCALALSALLMLDGPPASAVTPAEAKPAAPDMNASLKMDLDTLALKFSRKLQPPYRGTDAQEAKRYLRSHMPPLEPIGGWDRKDQQATRTDLTVLVCKQLRLPIPRGQEENPAAYWQALIYFSESQDPEAVQSVFCLFKDTWVSMQPVEETFLTESERSLLAFGFNLTNNRPPMDPPRKQSGITSVSRPSPIKPVFVPNLPARRGR